MTEPKGEHQGEQQSEQHEAPADDHYAPRPVAGWFMIAAIAALLFMSFGCVMYLMAMTADVSAMPLDQRAAFEATPTWVTGANALAVWVGLIGAVMLLLKNRFAEPVLAVSLLATLAWLGGLIGVSRLREALSASDLLVAIVVTALTWTIFWFARHSRQRGWLK